MWNDFRYLLKSDRKMQILVGLFTLLVLAVITVGVLKFTEGDKKTEGETVADMVEEEKEGDWVSNQVNGDINGVELEEASTSLGDSDVTTTFGGIIDSYVDRSTYGELTINIGNKDGKEEIFTVRTDSIVFDTVKKGVIPASQLNKAGSKVTLYSKGDIQGEEKKVGVAILNPVAEVMYGSVAKIEYHEGEEVYRITPTTNDRVFYYKGTKYVGNARTGDKVDISKLEEGDHVFIYPADKSELVGIDEDKEGRPMVAIQELYIVKSN